MLQNACEMPFNPQKSGFWFWHERQKSSRCCKKKEKYKSWYIEGVTVLKLLSKWRITYKMKGCNGQLFVRNMCGVRS